MESLKYTITDVEWAPRLGATVLSGTVLARFSLSWLPGVPVATAELVAQQLVSGQTQMLSGTLLPSEFRIPPTLGERRLWQELLNLLHRVLTPTNTWSAVEQGHSATIAANQGPIPDSAKTRLLSSFRAELLHLPAPQWPELWPRIKNRLNEDPAIQMHGFDRREFRRAIGSLENIFPWGWVRRQFHTNSGSGAGMTAQLSRHEPGWFPAYHLARLATGALCYDPGLNYLAELGLSLFELADFRDIALLRRTLARNQGAIHHVAYAADFHSRGLLVALEPSTGVGTAKSDLLVRRVSGHLEVELKFMTSEVPEARIRHEIREKTQKLPSHPAHAIVIHVVLLDPQLFDAERTARFVAASGELASSLPTSISGLGVGEMFVDGAGGRVKRRTISFHENPNALHPCSTREIERLFTSNFDRVTPPRFGVASFLEVVVQPPNE